VLGGQFHSFVDVTIVYPHGAPTFWQFLCGRMPEWWCVCRSCRFRPRCWRRLRGRPQIPQGGAALAAGHLGSQDAQIEELLKPGAGTTPV